jgi:hypothetical protein
MQPAPHSICSASAARSLGALGVWLLLGASTLGCGGGSDDAAGPGNVVVPNPLTDPSAGPAAGNAMGGCDVPADAGLADVSQPKTVVGDGSPESCTAQAFVDAVAAGGVITFDCGKQPITITLTEPAKVFNDASDEVVIDGGGLITLSGAGKTRILYMNTCDKAQHYTTPHCDNQDSPRLTVQNLTFVDGSTAAQSDISASGGAIYAQGGRFKAVNTRFFNNQCPATGADTGGGALRVLQQYNGLPANLVNCTFGGQDGYGNSGSNGGGISSIGVSWSIYNSVFSYNSAIGDGGNPAKSGTPGGGSGGAIYNDGNEMTLSLCGTLLEHNQVKSFGDAIFFVSNNHTGDIKIKDSTIRDNCGGSWNPTYPSISNHDDTPIDVQGSQIVGCGG